MSGLKPFGSRARKLQPFGSIQVSSRRKPKLGGKPWNERLKYLVQSGYIVVQRDGWWVICDRFSNPIVDENHMIKKYNNHVTAQQYADGRNKQEFELRLKELTGRV